MSALQFKSSWQLESGVHQFSMSVQIWFLITTVVDKVAVVAQVFIFEHLVLFM